MSEEIQIESKDLQEIQKEIPLLTFNSLYNILREEKKSKTLQQLPELFFEALEQYFKQKQDDIKKLQQSKDDDKLRKELNSQSNSKKICKELLSKRCQKISTIAIENHFSKEELHTQENISKKEEIFFKSVKDSISKLEKTIN